MIRSYLASAAFSALFLTACTPPESDANNEPSISATAEVTLSKADMLTKATLSEIADAIASGEVSSEEMTRAYLTRIETIDRSGPTLRSVLSLNPNAIDDAKAADAAREAGETLGPLHGVPLLIKDNIETKDPVATTAGALVLKDNIVKRDAPLTAGLREAGAIILGKANLSQWANFRSNESISGWSAMGGQVKNPHVLDRSPCGSSSGSGAATAASLAAGSVGTETNGSVICPSTINGIVGFKPTVGLVSQEGIVPISSTQDTAGPMVRSVRDAAIMLNAMATGPGAEVDFTAGLSDTSLQGKRIGVLRFAVGAHPGVSGLFDQALEDLKAQGAILVDITELTLPDGYGPGELKVLQVEYKHTLNAYLANSAPAVKHRTLKDVIAFNEANAEIELALFDQDLMDASEAEPGIDDPEYQAALAKILKATREDGIDKFLTENNVDVLVAPSFGPSWLVDAVYGDNTLGGAGAGHLAAIAGYPHLTVPMGTVRALPVGLSFISTAGDDAAVLAYGYDYEQATNHIPEPQYYKSVADTEAVAKANRPYVED